MAWIKNEQSEIEWGDGPGTIGGFGRGATDPVTTFVGPVYSPDGTAWYLVVDDLGALTATSTKP